jgi:transposase InsO family protein
MSYTTSPYAPAARSKAANLVLLRGYSKAAAARTTGVHRSTIGRWVAKAKLRNHYRLSIPTESSRPINAAGQLSPDIVLRIVELRKLTHRCAPAIHAQLLREEIRVSLSSVRRTIRRQGLARPLPGYRRKWYPPTKRPLPLLPGDLVQMDTVHLLRPDGSRYYLFTVLDVCSRWAYAEYRPHLSQRESFAVLMAAQVTAGFGFKIIQTDNGPEFGRWFHQMLLAKGLRLRHSRVRRPNDNAHLERFNRTIQEELLRRHRVKELQIGASLPSYLKYYNNERLHAGINYFAPNEIVAKLLT